ncbi:MAG: hypothetical protein QM723_03355 [Myxococcaceae bacterium]
MARSILPSRWRGAARAKAHLKRATRREVKCRLSQLTRDASAWEDEYGLDDDAWVGPVVRDRRGSDKLAHFERWAVRVTASLPQIDRLSAVRAVLPKGLIGQHAVEHLRWWPEFQHPNEAEVRAASRSRWYAGRHRSMDRGEMAELLRELLTVHEGHTAVNLVMRSSMVFVRAGLVAVRLGAPRMLHGRDDVLRFLGDVFARGGNERSQHALSRYLAAYKRTRNVRAAALELPEDLRIPNAWW